VLLLGEVGEETEVVSRSRDVLGAGLGDRFAHVPRLPGGEVLETLLDQVCRPVDDLATVGRVHSCPGSVIECATRGGNGAVGVDGLAAGDLGDHLVVDRRDRLERGARDGGDKLTADEVRDGKRAHGHSPQSASVESGMSGPRATA
jgi:hypothetical protein